MGCGAGISLCCEENGFCRVKPLSDTSSSAWRSVQSGIGSAVGRGAPPRKVYLRGGPQAAGRPGGLASADVLLRDTTGNGWYDSVVHRGPPMSGAEGKAVGAPIIALDTSGDGRADTILQDTSEDGRYDKVINRLTAPLSFLATMSRVSSRGGSQEPLSRAASELFQAATRSLAPGWERVLSESQQSYYYVHRETKRTTWDAKAAELPPWSSVQPPPGDPAAIEEEGQLSPGWEFRKSKAGRGYYFHPATGRSTWSAAEAMQPLPLCPPYWKHKAEENEFMEVVHTQSLCRDVQMLLTSTFLCIRTRDRKTRLPIAMEVKRVWRIENAMVWRRYAEHRERLENLAVCSGGSLTGCTPVPKTAELLSHDLGDHQQRSMLSAINEVYLFHGTAGQSALGIAANGFDIRRAAKSACYGPGLYFSECSSKSDEYGSDEPDGLHKGECAMFICRVLLGRVLPWQTEFNPELSVVWGAGCYDSILGDRVQLRGTYREFVLPPESCHGAYPEYLVVYRRVADDPG